MLYGVTMDGGICGEGVIFRFNCLTDEYQDIFDFSDSVGSYPLSELLISSCGELYGTTYSGGAPRKQHAIFSYNPLNNSFQLLYSFDFNNGQGYSADLILASDGKLYGSFPANIFSFDLATNTFTDLYDFNLTERATNGLVQASDGFLYGAASIFSSGITHLYRFDISNNTLSIVQNLNFSDGLDVTRSLSQADNGKLYGAARTGGSYGVGTFFSLDINTQTFTKLLDLDSNSTGSYPDCQLAEITTLPTGLIATLKSTEDLQIYPQPASGSLTITSSLINQSAIKLNIYDITGRAVSAPWQIEVGKINVDVSKLAAGSYVLNLSADTASAKWQFCEKDNRNFARVIQLFTL